jgi:amino acid transporter
MGTSPQGSVIADGPLLQTSFVFPFQSQLYLTLVSMATGGFYISFALPVLGALWVRLKGRWAPSEFSLGRWGLSVAIAASVWTVFEYFNIAWPRAEGVPWYQDWAVFLMTGIVAALGVLAYIPGRSNLRAAEDRLEADPTATHWGSPEAHPPGRD